MDDISKGFHGEVEDITVFSSTLFQNTIENRLYKKHGLCENPFCEIIKNIYKEKYNFSSELELFHDILDEPFFVKEKENILQIAELGKNDRKAIFITDYYNYVDNHPIFIKHYKEFIISNIKPLFPNETTLVYQTTPNLRICFPGSTAIGRRSSDPSPDVIGIHSDDEFNHTKEEINFILPITDMYETNSLYFEPSIHSDIHPQDFLELNLNTKELFICYFNKLRHYNRINNTGKTRFSLDFRVIPFSKYHEHTENSISYQKKMTIGDYFQII